MTAGSVVGSLHRWFRQTYAVALPCRGFWFSTKDASSVIGGASPPGRNNMTLFGIKLGRNGPTIASVLLLSEVPAITTSWLGPTPKSSAQNNCSCAVGARETCVANARLIPAAFSSSSVLPVIREMRKRFNLATELPEQVSFHFNFSFTSTSHQ